MGEDTNNIIGDLASGVTDLVKGFEEFSRSDFGKGLSFFVIASSAVMGAILLVVGGLAGLAASLQAVSAAWKEMGDSSLTASARISSAFRVVSLSLGIVGIIATVVTLAG